MQAGKIYKLDNVKKNEEKIEIEFHDFYQIAIYE